jgi:hypothetical protein
MFKNIYRYKIKYINILGGSTFVNENTSENNRAANTLQNQNNLEEAIENFQNLEIIEPENISSFTIKFKDRNEWPLRALDWSSQVDYEFLEDFVWDENGEGKIISGNQISFINSPYQDYILVNNRFAFKTDAFGDEDQNKLTIFLQNNGINLDENEIAEEIEEEFVLDENSIQFKNINEWPQNQYEWSSMPSLNLSNVIWDENGEGKIISGNRISFSNSSLQYYIVVDNRFAVKTDAFTEESQNTLGDFLRSNGITIY